MSEANRRRSADGKTTVWYCAQSGLARMRRASAPAGVGSSFAHPAMTAPRGSVTPDDRFTGAIPSRVAPVIPASDQAPRAAAAAWSTVRRSGDTGAATGSSGVAGPT